MLHVTRAPHGGLAIGVGALGTAIWAQRKPHCHRWRLWRTRLPKAPAPWWDDRGFGATGVREPRRPPPRDGGSSIALDPPELD